MLSKTAHIVYISVIVVLLGALLLQRGPSPGNSQSQAPQHEELLVSVDDAADQDEEIRKELSPLNIDESIDASRPGNDDRSRVRPLTGESPWDRGPRPDGAHALPVELVARSVEVASDIDTDLGARLARLREKNAAGFERQLRRSQAGRRLLAMAQLKERDPDLYRSKLSELTQAVEINKLAGDLREAMQANTDPGRIESLKSQLRTKLQLQFVMSIKSRGEYLCRIEEQITRVRDDIDRECKHFQGTIEARMKHLMQSPDQPMAEQPALNQAPTAIPASSRMVQPDSN